MAQLNWTFEALESLDRISENLSEYSEKYAAHFVKTVFEKVDALCNFPYIGRKVPEMNQPSIRELIVLKHRIIYSVPDSDTVYILTIHPSALPITELNI